MILQNLYMAPQLIDNDKVDSDILRLHLKTAQRDNLMIFKHSKETNCDEAHQYKGMIVDTTTGRIVAPAARIPLATIREDGSCIDPLSLDVVSIYPSLDAVQYRIYYNPTMGRWETSVNSFIYPTNKWSSGRTFIEMFNDEPLDYDQLNKDYCYFVLLEHPDNHNVIKHESYKRTLCRVTHDGIECDIHQLSVTGAFPNVLPRLPLGETLELITNILVSTDQINPAPVTGHAGYLVEDRNGNLYRYETREYKDAAKYRINDPDFRKHWVYNRHCQETYLSYFPTETEIFKDMSDQYLKTCKLIYEHCSLLSDVISDRVCGGETDKDWINIIQESKRYLTCTDIHSRHLKTTFQIWEKYYKGREWVDYEDIYRFIDDKDLAEIYYLINPNNCESHYSSSVTRVY